LAAGRRGQSRGIGMTLVIIVIIALFAGYLAMRRRGRR
jgi:hypothetical protein